MFIMVLWSYVLVVVQVSIWVARKQSVAEKGDLDDGTECELVVCCGFGRRVYVFFVDFICDGWTEIC